MAEKGSSRSRKSSKRKLNAERFAYDVLAFTLRAGGFPEAKLQVKECKENDYSNPDFVATAHAVVTALALNSRDKWRRMFESRLKSSGLGNMEKIKKYLSTIMDVLPEFRSDEDDSDRIMTSLALYSEFILFLNSNGIEVSFEKLLNKWSSYFHEKIALNKDQDELLEALYVEHPDVHGYLSLVIYFIRDVATPYGKRDDVSVEFGKFSEAMENFDDERRASLADEVQNHLVDRLGFVPHDLYDPPPEAVGEAMSFLTGIFERDTVLPGDRDSPEPPVLPHGPSACAGAMGVEDRLKWMNLGNEEAFQVRRDDKTKRRQSDKKSRR
ncbi:hypothetical protein HNY73_019153 [Argiope bruennichi]|uniref:Uncharacterized protein n=1 Tax=Argiope bruennichi TaxID=94029 RepID=A0A8T0EKA1_ARGBR|nr:hypothetical protein HNY73_019153 [Argiope bruennichi]